MDDTQDALTEIREHIPEEHRLQAAPPTNHEQQQTSGSMPPQPQPPASAGNPPVTGDGASRTAGDSCPFAAPHHFARQFVDFLKPRMKPAASPGAHPNMRYNVVSLHLINDVIMPDRVARSLSIDTE